MLTLALICIACAVYWVWRLMNTKPNEPPYFPGAWPIVGHAPLLIGDSCHLWDVLNDIADKCYDIGGVASISIAPGLGAYIITDPDDLFTVANTCLEKDVIYHFAKPWLGEGLATAELSIWKNHRKLMNPAFNQTVLHSFMGVLNNQSRKLVKALAKEVGRGPFDHSTYMRHNALETICLTALGVDFTDSNLNSQYVEAMQETFMIILERVIKFWWHSPYTFAWSKLKKKHDACLKFLLNKTFTILQKRKSEFNGNVCAERSIISGTKFKAFLDLLLELSIQKGCFNDEEIRMHLDTMIVAGHNTSFRVVMFTMILLGSHSEAQEKVYVELQEVLGDRDRNVEKTDLSKLVYLEAVLKESMRLFTVFAVVARKLDRDIKLKYYTLSAGRTCFLFLFGLHKHPIWGPDVHQFKPERWLEPGKLPDNPNAFAAFSVGRRNCIGKAYALMSMKTTLAHVVRCYRITADHTKMRLKIVGVLEPHEGHFVSIERRTLKQAATV